MAPGPTSSLCNEGSTFPPSARSFITAATRELDRLQLLLAQIKMVEVERDTLLDAERAATPAAMVCSTSRASGLNSPLSCGWRGCSDISTTGDKLRLMQAWLQRLGRADRSIGNGAYRRPAIPDYEQHCSSSPGSGFVISQSQRSATGSRNGSRAAAAILKKQRLAMARKLLVPLWKYVTAGVVIDRVVMKTA